MKKIILIVLILLMNGCKKESNEFNKEKKWTTYKTKDSIPKLLNDKILKEYNKNFDIADFNEKFNATDLLIDSLPTRQLRLLARKDNHWRMVYIQGGFGKYNVLIECEINGDSITNFKIAETLFRIDNNDSIDYLISKEKLKFKRIKF